MDTLDTQTLDSVPGEESHVDSSEGAQNDVDNSNTTSGALTLDEINSLLGRRYKTIDDAKKGLEEHKKMVGKKTIEVPTEDMYGYTAREVFTLKHPGSDSLLDSVFAAAKALKQTPEEVFQSTFKEAYEAKLQNRSTREESLKSSPVDSINRSSDNRISPEFTEHKADLDTMSLDQLKKLGTNALKRQMGQ